MILAVAVLFLNEEEHLPRLLTSIAAQTRPPDHLLLVDDGSDDGSAAIAERFAAEHPYARVLPRPRRPRDRDRLAAAAELQAFQWAVGAFTEPYDAIAKLDGDLELPPRFFEAVAGALEGDPRLGIAGAALRVPDGAGSDVAERSASWHVRGATKFYRRECWTAISPLPVILGWDTIDEMRARQRGWEVRIVDVPDGTALHLRPTGTYNGAIRGFRRKGIAAWGYGAHPLAVLVSAFVRLRERPRVLAGLAYLGGYISAAIHQEARAEPELVTFVRREQLRRLRRAVAGGRTL